jgi:hypothetical protein
MPSRSSLPVWYFNESTYLWGISEADSILWGHPDMVIADDMAIPPPFLLFIVKVIAAIMSMNKF